MDINCRNCGEPWDIDTIHDVAADEGSDFDTVRKAFAKDGCVALGGRDCRYETCPAECGGSVLRPSACERCGGKGRVPRTGRPLVASLSGALQDLFGDDIDGVGAELEDAAYLGLFD